MINTLIGMPQGLEWLVILAIVILVFGAAKLPDLARSSGQALRIFKTETKGLRDDESSSSDKPSTTGELGPGSQGSQSSSGDAVRERRDDTTA
jgi:sec-independent protein translocase protein TatA